MRLACFRKGWRQGMTGTFLGVQTALDWGEAGAANRTRGAWMPGWKAGIWMAVPMERTAVSSPGIEPQAGKPVGLT
jgi:hypothetical protein